MEHSEIFKALQDLTTNKPGTPDGVDDRVKVLSDFDDEKQRELHLYIIGEKKLPDSFVASDAAEGIAEDAVPPENELPAEEAPLVVPVVPEVKATARTEPRNADTRRELETAQGTLERARQRKAAYDAKLNEVKIILNRAAPDRVLDPEGWDVWNEDRVNALRKQGEITAEYAQARDNDDIEANSKFINNQTFTETIEGIGEEFEALKLPKPFWNMNSDYEGWLKKAIVASGQADRDIAYNRFKSDPEFAKLVGPMPEGSEKLFVYLNAMELQKKIGGDLEGAVLKQARASGIFKSQVETARAAGIREAAEKNDKALAARQNSPRPASLAGGGGGKPEAPVRPHDLESSRAWLKDWQARVGAGTYKPSKSERERDESWTAEAQAWLSGQKNVEAPLSMR